MMKDTEKSIYMAKLIVKSFQNNLTVDERKHLNIWLSDAHNRKLYDSLRLGNLTDERRLFLSIDVDKNWKTIENRIPFKKRIYVSSWLKYAAVIIFPLLIAAFFVLNRTLEKSPEEFSLLQSQPMPGGAKAILVMSDGKTVNLTDYQNYKFMVDSTVDFINCNNVLTVEEKNVSREENMQSLYIPQGGEYRMLLADGTKVWLNAESCIRFPASFSGEKRTVYLDGEAYFEVAHNKEKPFIVVTKDLNVEVLGTKFDMKSYASDDMVYTTLAEGKVRTTDLHKGDMMELSPDQQCQYNRESGVMEKKKVNAAAYIGWIKGKFVFDNEPLKEIMKQLGRWYGTEVTYQNPELEDYRFTAHVDRFENISTILQMLEKTYNLKFSIHGKNIIVSRE